MPVPQHIRVTAPGRICLFGEHQDFLGLPVISCAIDLAMEIVGMPWPDSIDGLALGDSELPDDISRCVRAQFTNRDLCQQAYSTLRAPSFDSGKLGEMLLEHQCELREGIGVSHPKLDRLIDDSVAAGAAGGRGYITAVRDGVTVEVE